jgi:glucose dehydrogenase
MPARDYSSTRYSPLAEISRSSVGALELAFSFSTSIDKGH